MRSDPVKSLSIFTLSSAIGMMATLTLLLSISLLTGYRSDMHENRELLVVELSTWPTPAKAERPPQPPKQKKPLKHPPKPKSKPKPKKVEPPKLTEKKPIEIPQQEPIQETNVSENINAEAAPEPEASPTPTEETVEERLPTPVPFFALTHAPQFLHREEPVYPEVMRSRSIAGIVKLEALIDENGRVRKVKVIKSAGEHFDHAAKQAMIKSTFIPAEVDGRPVAVILRVPVKFKLL